MCKSDNRSQSEECRKLTHRYNACVSIVVPLEKEEGAETLWKDRQLLAERLEGAS